MSNTPNSWEDTADSLSAKTSKITLNPNAPTFEFKPNVNAKEFVPSWAPAAAPVQVPATTPSTAPAPTPVADTPVAKVLKIGGSSDSASAVETKKDDKSAPKVPELAKAKSNTSSRAATPQPSKKEDITEHTDVPDIQADIQQVDDEVVTDLYGKEHMNVVFMGHVDAGKSTMGGNILFLTGMVDKRTMEKYEKEAKEAGRESWYLSWALDTNAEERAKGKTVESGRAFFETEKRKYTILDAPGHKNYVPAMLSSASQADVGVLVISARKGEFETGFERGGQTREHTVLAKTSGVNKLVVAINKMDDPTVNYDKARFDEIVTKFTPFLKNTGYNPKTDVYFIPVSGYTGLNIKDRGDKISWYSGPSLLEYLDSMPMLDRKLNSPFLMPLTEKFKDMGTIVVGKLESGKIKKNQAVLLMPNKRICEVAAIMNETDEEVNAAVCGDNVRIRLRGVEEEDVSPGFVLCDAKNPVKITTLFEAQIAILEHESIICAGYECILHVHTCVEEISIAAFLHLIDKKTGRKSKRPPQFVKQGQKVIARFETSGPICVEAFDEHPQLGRFTLRDKGRTIAIGKITKILENEPTAM